MSVGNDFTHVEFAAMEQSEADFQRTYASLADVLDQLQSQLAANLAEWDGSAQQAFHEAHLTWSAAMANMQDAIAGIASTIGQAHQNYREAEQSIAARWA